MPSSPAPETELGPTVVPVALGYPSYHFFLFLSSAVAVIYIYIYIYILQNLCLYTPVSQCLQPQCVELSGLRLDTLSIPRRCTIVI
jgi:hypothetical protein